MNKLDKLRLLIWDRDANVFTDDELQEFLTDCGENVYKTAATCLNIVRANPERYTSYSLGGLSFSFGAIDNAIEKYEKLAVAGLEDSDGKFYTTSSEREY